MNDKNKKSDIEELKKVNPLDLDWDVKEVKKQVKEEEERVKQWNDPREFGKLARERAEDLLSVLKKNEDEEEIHYLDKETYEWKTVTIGVKDITKPPEIEVTESMKKQFRDISGSIVEQMERDALWATALWSERPMVHTMKEFRDMSREALEELRVGTWQPALVKGDLYYAPSMRELIKDSDNLGVERTQLKRADELIIDLLLEIGYSNTAKAFRDLRAFYGH